VLTIWERDNDNGKLYQVSVRDHSLNRH